MSATVSTPLVCSPGESPGDCRLDSCDLAVPVGPGHGRVYSPRRDPAAAGRHAPADCPGENVRDELVQAHPLPLRDPRQFGVKRLRHPKQQTAAV